MIIFVYERLGFFMNNMSDKNDFPSLDNVISNIRSARYAQALQAEKLNSISNYIYQAIIFQEMIPALADLFEDIAIDEMRHYKILGVIIKKLGANPTIRARVQNNAIDYDFNSMTQANDTARKVIENNIKDKEKAAMEYHKLSESTDDPAVSEIYRRISEEEAQHARLLKQILYS